jgi:two-component system OmpR family sensor kinase
VRLRHTLVTLQIALVAVGLLVFGVTSYQLYRHSEETRLRNQLTQDTPSLEAALCAQAGAGCSFPQRPDGDGDDAGGGAPVTTTTATTTAGAPSREVCGFRPVSFLGSNLAPGSFIQERSASGAVVARLDVPFSPFSAYDGTTPTCPQPDLPKRVSTGTFQVGAVDGPGPFLVEVVTPGMGSAPGTGGRLDLTVPAGTVYVVGIPLANLHSSLHRLLTLDLAVGGILLVALAGGSLLLIRRSLRPLERMATTSRAISTGDLSRRITATDSRSEVGQLGLALNGMLTRIERAFADRDATEQRLRQFLADASHELRTPLTSIRGYAELWRISRDGGTRPATGDGVELDADTAMARIEEHARRMGEMIEELLLLARLDETHPSRHAPVDLAVVAAEACDDASALDPTRPISLHADDDVIVAGDAAHLRRAVTNLLTNAVRHTPPGTPVEVRVGVDGGVAELVVRDHGPGLPAAGLAHAFDRFWQADASRATGGSGLGLATVAGVAAEHGGAAIVTNAPDGGAVLTLRLPRPLPPPPDAPAPGPARRDDQPSTR